MASEYKKCGKEVQTLCAQLIKEHHPDLHAAGVSVDLIFAHAAENGAGEKIGTALKSHGYVAAAVASKVALIHRVMGRGDVQILIDGDKWPDLHEDQQAALLDHELQHFVVAKDAEGGVILDTHGRPKIKMRLHDFEFGWFTEVAKRHREASVEVIQAAQIYQQAGQAYFPFLGQQSLPEAAQEPKPKKKK